MRGAVLSLSFVEPNTPDRPDEPDRPAPRHALRNSEYPNFFLPLTLILLVRNFTNSLQAGKMGAYLQASTYVSPTLLLTFLFLRRGP